MVLLVPIALAFVVSFGVGLVMLYWSVRVLLWLMGATAAVVVTAWQHHQEAQTKAEAPKA